MRKVISFALYGSDPKYCVGAAKNVWLARHWYPGWQCMFWIDAFVPTDCRKYLEREGAEVRLVNDPALGGGCFWRFLVNDLPDVERYIVRDTDSRFTEREALAVEAWVKSGKSFHCMRDHPHHDTAVLGGLWGAIGSAAGGPIPNMREQMLKFIAGQHCDPFKYDCDQAFLRDVLWAQVKGGALQHDTCFRNKYPGSIPFPAPLSYDSLRFVGEVFDEFDEPRPYDWELTLGYVE